MPLFRLLGGASALLAFLPSCSAQVVFQAPQAIATGFQRVSGYAVGDFNGDGKPDLVFTDGSDKRVVVYLNNGKGGFGAATSTTLNVNFTVGGIAVGDVNEDGKQDLIVSAAGTLTASYLLLGNGDGTFTDKGAIPGSEEFLQGKLVDLNGDKHLDLVYAGNATAAVFLGDGNGNFTSRPIAGQPGDGPLPGLTVADFNRDDKPDVVFADFGNPNSGAPTSLQFYPGVGDGTFGAPSFDQPFPGSNGYSYVAAADFNGDGKPDLAFSLPIVAAIAFGNGDGTFQLNQSQLVIPQQGPSDPSSTVTAAPPLAVADFDASGTQDIAVFNPVKNLLVLSLNDGTGTFPQANPDFQASIDANTFFIVTADLNGDGRPDLITGSYTTNNILVFLSVPTKRTPAVALTLSAAEVASGSALTLSAAVTTGAGAVPTGTVTFSDGNTSLGQAALDGTGKASLTTSALLTGQHSLTASYSGDGNYNAAVSAAVTESIVDFSVSNGTASQTIKAGGSANYSITLTGSPGLSGMVLLTCTGLPAGYACASNPVSIGTQPTTATVTVGPTSTVSAQSAVLRDGKVRDAALAALPLGLCLVVGLRRRRFGAGLLCAVAFTGLCAGMTACSSSSSDSNTYHGTTSFTINAAVTVGTQTVSHGTSETLIVQ